MKRVLFAPVVLALAAALALAGCAKGRSSDSGSTSNTSTGTSTQGEQAGATQAAAYIPKTRTINMISIPSWIGEMATIPAFKEFAPQDFKKGGLNDGNEVFTWDPQTIGACAGDTISLQIANPGPDDHTFTLPDFSVNTPVPVGKVTPVSFRVTKAGIYDYYCTVAEHTRYMHGTLLVFDDSSPMCG
jgi:plastocyanin